jgi:hypothetical protein
LPFAFFVFVLKYRVLPLFCSNPDALGVDESEKVIFSSLKTIAQLPPSPPKDDDWLGDSATGTAENLSTGEAGKKSPTAGTGEWLL